MLLLATLTVVLMLVFGISLMSSHHSVKGDGTKLQALEGLRGLAAFVVVVVHTLSSTASGIFGHPAARGASWLWLSKSPAYLLFSGRAAVDLFFILSGFALSYAFLTSGKRETIISGVLRRYPRLALPIVFTTCIALVLEFPTGTASLFADAIRKTAFDSFIRCNTEYNAVLWTIHSEFLGSILVYGLLFLSTMVPFRPLLYVATAILLWDKPTYIAFLLGTILCDVWCSGGKGLARKWGLILLPIGTYFAAYPGMLFSQPELSGTCYGWIGGSADAVIVLGCACLLYSVLSAQPLQWGLSTKFCQFLGLISFSLYLLHLCVIRAVLVPIVQALAQMLPLSFSILLGFLLTLPVLLMSSYLLYLYVDRPSVLVSKHLYRFIRSLLVRKYDIQQPELGPVESRDLVQAAGIGRTEF